MYNIYVCISQNIICADCMVYCSWLIIRRRHTKIHLNPHLLHPHRPYEKGQAQPANAESVSCQADASYSHSLTHLYLQSHTHIHRVFCVCVHTHSSWFTAIPPCIAWMVFLSFLVVYSSPHSHAHTSQWVRNHTHTHTPIQHLRGLYNVYTQSGRVVVCVFCVNVCAHAVCWKIHPAVGPTNTESSTRPQNNSKFSWSHRVKHISSSQTKASSVFEELLVTLKRLNLFAKLESSY